MNKVFQWISVGTLVFFMGGCASAIQGHGESLKKFDTSMDTLKCDFQEIDKKIESKDDVILWGIQGGSLARNCKNFQKSNTLFDKAEEIYKTDADMDNALNNVGESAKSVLVNNNVNEYEGCTYEKVMVNTYKGLNFLSLNDKDNARVEFNRAIDRQRRAKEYFEKEIAQKQAKNKDNPDTAVAQNQQTIGVINQAYAGDFDFTAYPDFVNPFTTYVSGLFFLLDGSYNKASDLWKEALLMDPLNPVYKEDLALAEAMANASNKSMKQKYAWVIYENGQGMAKDEIRIDIPLFLVTQKVFYTGIALPKLKKRNESYAHLSLRQNNTELAKTTMVANMDAVIQTEFSKKFPLIVSEAILNTVAKTVSQQQLQKKTGLVGGLLGAVYQGMTNRADVRSWTALPKNFQIARVPLNGMPLEIVSDNGTIIKTETIPNQNNAIIYVKSPQMGNHIVHAMLF